jgi:hypothetical protein
MPADLKILLDMMEIAKKATDAGHFDLAITICKDVIGYLTEEIED